MSLCPSSVYLFRRDSSLKISPLFRLLHFLLSFFCNPALPYQHTQNTPPIQTSKPQHIHTQELRVLLTMAPLPPPLNSIALPFSQNGAVNTAYGAPAIPYSTNIRNTQKEDYPKTTHETLAEQFVSYPIFPSSSQRIHIKRIKVNNPGAFVRSATKDKEYVEVITSVPEMALEEKLKREDESNRLMEEENTNVEDEESGSADGENAEQDDEAVESAVGETAKQEQGVAESSIGNNTDGGLELTPGDGSAQVYGYFDYVLNVIYLQEILSWQTQSTKGEGSQE